MAAYLRMYLNALPRNPQELVTVFHREGGTSSQLHVYYDPETNLEYLKCDLCSKFYKIGKGRSTKNMVDHRGTLSCEKEKEKFARFLSVWNEQRRAEKAREAIRMPGANRQSTSAQC
jgi:hypothetical protein